MQKTTLYEFPLSERARNFMRLENLFTQIKYFSHHNSTWDSHAGLSALIEILNILDRKDLRGDVLKELERNINTLNSLLDIPGVDLDRLHATLNELQTHKLALLNIETKATSSTREDELLNSIRQRAAISANINCFEIPSFYYWLQHSSHSRHEQLTSWLQDLNPIANGIYLLNKLLRDSQLLTEQKSTAGFYQQPLNPQQICQMVRIELPADANYFPEISGSKHRVNIRFLCYESSAQRPTQVTHAIDFKLSCCSL